MLVYEITDEKSFENIAKWLRNIDEVSCIRCLPSFHCRRSIADVPLLSFLMVGLFC